MNVFFNVTPLFTFVFIDIPKENLKHSIKIYITTLSGMTETMQDRNARLAALLTSTYYTCCSSWAQLVRVRTKAENHLSIGWVKFPVTYLRTVPAQW